MRYEISYNRPSRMLMGMVGTGPGQSSVEVDDDTIHAKLGWSGNVTIPRSDIARVERVDSIPWWLGIGLHGGMGGTWALNGSGTGAVKLTLRGPAAGKVLGMPIRPRTIYFSLEDPDGFVANVGLADLSD